MPTKTAAWISPYLTEISAAQSNVSKKGRFKKFRCPANAQKDPAHLLPPAARHDSSSQQKEMAEVRHFVRSRTPERCSQTVWAARQEDPSFLAATLGPVFNPQEAGEPPTALLPFGEAILAYSFGGPMAELLPEKAQAILACVAAFDRKVRRVR